MPPYASATRPRVLVFALDACEWSLIQRWTASGELPTFRRLLADGAHGTLRTVAEQLPDTVWSTIYAGRNPATFSKYFYVQYDPRTGDLRHVKDDEFTDRPFWDVLADHGRKVGVVDAVKIPASRKVAFSIANWGAHATKSPRVSHPAELLPDLDRRLGRNPVGDVDRVSDTLASRQDMRDRILRGIGLRQRLLETLCDERDWDVLVVGVSEMHQAGHHYWHGVDTNHPRHREIVEQGLADTVLRVYQGIDTMIGALIDRAGPDAMTMVVAGHGMGPIWHASWSLPEMLDLLGYGPRPARRAAGEAVESKPSFWRWLKMALPGSLQYTIKGFLPERVQDELLFRWYAGKRDWQGWRAHAIPNNDSCGAIRIAVKGRDPHGIVDPKDYDAVLSDLQAAIEELVDPATGRSVVHSTTRLHEVFHGPYAEEKPDLVVCWEQSFPWTEVESPRFGRIKIRTQDSRTGSHTPRGFVCVHGPGVAAGERVEGHSVLDIAPTILTMVGIDVPEEMEGAPLPVLGRHART